jgi:hypothetical protein
LIKALTDGRQQVLIMTTYYAAQLGIALSVVDSKASYIREEESRKKKQRHSLLEDSEQEGGSIMAAGTDIRHRRIGSVES